MRNKMLMSILAGALLLVFSGERASAQLVIHPTAAFGRWSSDLEGARQLAKANTNFYVICFARLSGCSSSDQANKVLFNSPGLYQWSISNKIALVYGDYNRGEGDPLIAHIRRTYPDARGFPTIILVDGEGGSRVGLFGVSSGAVYNGMKLNPFNAQRFLEVLDTFFEVRDDLPLKAMRLAASPTERSESLFRTYHGSQGKGNTLSASYSNVGFMYFQYSDPVDWYCITNTVVQEGKGYRIAVSGAYDPSNLVSVSVYKNLTDANALTGAVASCSLMELAEMPLQYVPPLAGSHYIRFSREIVTNAIGKQEYDARYVLHYQQVDLSLGEYSFTTNAVAYAEDLPAATVTVYRTNDLDKAATVRLLAGDGTAKRGIDYQVTNEVAFAANQATQQVAVALFNTGCVWRGDRTFRLKLDVNNPPTNIITELDFTILETDPDDDRYGPANHAVAGAPQFEFTSDRQSVTNLFLHHTNTVDHFVFTNLVAGQVYKIVVTNSCLTNAVNLRAELLTNGVGFSTHVLAAQAGTVVEYTAATANDLTLRVARDANAPADPPACVCYAFAYYQWQKPKYAFATNSITVESNAVVRLTVQRSEQTNEVTQVAWGTEDDTAKAGSDYVAATNDAVFGIGEESQTIEVTVANMNDKYVGPRSFTVALQPGDKHDLGAVSNVTVTIAGDPVGGAQSVWSNAVPLAVATTNISTGARYLNHTDTQDWIKLGPVESNKTYRVVVSDLLVKPAGYDAGQAAVTFHYVAGGDIVVTNFPAMSLQSLSEQRVLLPFGGAMLAETNYVWVSVQRPADDTVYLRYALDVREWVKPVVTFGYGAVDVPDTANHVQVAVLRTNNTEVSTSVDVWTEKGANTAAGTDYTHTSNRLVFAEGETNKTFTVPVTPDRSNVWTGDRQFGIVLRARDEVGDEDGIVYGPHTNVTVTLRENDPELDANDPADDAAAGAPVVPLSRVQTNLLATLNGSDTNDWFRFSGILSNRLYRFGLTNFVHTGDAITEPVFSFFADEAGVVNGEALTNMPLSALLDEAFIYRSLNTDDIWVRVARAPGAVHVRYALACRELMPCTARFAVTDVEVSEAAGQVRLQVAVEVEEAGSLLDLDVFVRARTRDGTAVANQDYWPVSTVLEWKAGTAGGVQDVVIQLANYDYVWEGDESFYVDLEPESDVQVVAGAATATITLIEKDAPTRGQIAVAGTGDPMLDLKAGGGVVAAREGDMVRVWFERSDGYAEDVTAIWTWTDGRDRTEVVLDGLFASREDGLKAWDLVVPELPGYQAVRRITGTLSLRLPRGQTTPTLDRTRTTVTVQVTDRQFGGTLAEYAADPSHVPLRSGGDAWYVGVDGSIRSTPPIGANRPVVMAMTVKGPGTLRYTAEVANGDAACALTVCVGAGAAQAVAVGQNELAVPGGTQNVVWQFTRGMASPAEAHAVLRDIEWIPAEDAEAYGTFAGYAYGREDRYGLASMTVAANGRIAGRLLFGHRIYAFTAAGYGEVMARAGTERIPLTVAAVTDMEGRATGKIEIVEVSDEDDKMSAVLYRNGWGDRPMTEERARALEACVGYYTVALAEMYECGDGYLTITVAANGAVRAAGRLADGVAVSLGGTLALDADGVPHVVLFSAPASYRGGYVWLYLKFDADAAGEAPTVIRGAEITGSEVPGCHWWSHNPRATGVEGEGFLRFMDVGGGWYDRLATLRDYYAGRALGAEIDSAGQPFAPLYTGPSAARVTNELAAIATREWPVRLDVNAAGTGFIVTEQGKNAASRFTMRVNPVTGLFSGLLRAVYPYKGREITRSSVYQGVLTPVRPNPQDGLEGHGYFLMPDWSEDGTYQYKRSYPLWVTSGD
ncbi:MAG TPA: Calx-beta domain-containing protein [Kiritimatiellia bacterium]|nr:Calx-beta domain-containing protein [Kiritimatiellia bacterium]